MPRPLKDKCIDRCEYVVQKRKRGKAYLECRNCGRFYGYIDGHGDSLGQIKAVIAKAGFYDPWRHLRSSGEGSLC